MHAPRMPHLLTAKRNLRYIKGTPQTGILFTPTNSFQLTGYSDTDWTGCLDTRRSTSGFAIFLGSNHISWSSRKQPTIAKSSSEAEYRALASLSTELIWYLHLLKFLNILLQAAPVIYCDNISSIYMATNPIVHNRSNHIEIDAHFIREKVVAGIIRLRYIYL